MTTTIVIIGIVFVAFIIAIAGIYSRLVTLRNRYKNAFPQIDAQLKRLYDLIPNLVETAKGYIQHEHETLEAVIQARNWAINASQKASRNPGDMSAMQDMSDTVAMFSGTLGSLFELSKNYPDLKANPNMQQVKVELTSTGIPLARRVFNDAVTAYNTTCKKFPYNIVAGMFNFTQAELFIKGSRKM